MPQLSNRVNTFTDSVIRRMTRISDEYGAINLSQGFPDFDPPKAMLDALIIDDELPYNVADLSKKLDKQNVFDIRFYSIILFYWGVITLKDKYYMTFPNKTMRNVLLL